MSKHSSVSPIDDLTFDVLTVLREKAKALAAYEKYLGDADAEDDDELRDLFLEMRKQDEEHVHVLKDVLARRLEDDLGYDDTDEVDVDDEVDDDIEDVLEDYDDVDEEQVEEPSSKADPARGDDAMPPPVVPSTPRRGESTQRHR